MTDLLADGGDQLRRERREITGIGLTMATVIMSLNFLIVFGVATLPHLTNPVFLWIWASFVVSALVVGGFGLANLIRGGFFKRLKERESRLHLMKVEQERQTLPEASEGAAIGAGPAARLAEPVSVTETTTRELEAIPRADSRDFT